MRKKRIYALFLTMVLTVGIIGCGSDKDEAHVPDDTAKMDQAEPDSEELEAENPEKENDLEPEEIEEKKEEAADQELTDASTSQDAAEENTQEASSTIAPTPTVTVNKAGSVTTVKTPTKPTAVPTGKPAAKPTTKPITTPKAKPTARPTSIPKAKPTTKPTAKPTTAPKPTAIPSKPTTTTPKPTVKPTATPTPAHTHNWIPSGYKKIHHDATGHYETKVVQDAWDEPVFENRTICNQCGKDLTNFSEDALSIHMGEYGHSYSIKPVKVGSIHHDAVTKRVWVEDSAAWDESVITGYKCTGCGATK